MMDRFGGLMSLGGESSPVIMVGLVLAILLPLLILIGVFVRLLGHGAQFKPVAVSVEDVGRSSPVGERDGRTHTIITSKRAQVVAGEADAGGGGAGPQALRRVTTQVLRKPRRTGLAQIIVEADGDVDSPSSVRADGQADGADRENTDRYAAGGARETSGHANDRGPSYGFPASDMMRIGRETDNDIVLRSKTVHRYHAVVRRTVDAGYIVTDLSGEDGNGVHVNGERCYDAQLNDGDEVRLGTAKLRFVGG